MKKVFIIAPEFFDYGKSVERAFVKLGLETRLIEVSYLYKTPVERLEYYADKEKYFAKKKNTFNAEMLRIYDEFKPDMVFVIQEGNVNRETLQKMNNAVKVVWMMDTINRNTRGYVIWDLVDHVFFFERSDIDVLWESHKIEGRFLPLALDEAVYFPMERKDDIDLFFVGSLYEHRMDVLREICRTYPDKNVQVYGTKNQTFFKRVHFNLFREHKKTFKNRNIAPSIINELYNRSRICLNIHHGQNKHGVNQRFFEIPGSRSFQLVDDNDYISTFFAADEIMTFRSRSELMEAVSSLMKGEIDTEKMVARAYQKIISGHTFTHRMKYVLDTLSSNS